LILIIFDILYGDNIPNNDGMTNFYCKMVEFKIIS